MASQRHIIAITLQNESGALTRVAGLFSTRGYNIESLNVAPTDDPAVSRLTLVTTGNDAVIHQISQQLLKLVDVVDVEDVTREEHFERELLLVKVKAKATQVGSLWSATQRAGGREPGEDRQEGCCQAHRHATHCEPAPPTPRKRAACAALAVRDRLPLQAADQSE